MSPKVTGLTAPPLILIFLKHTRLRCAKSQYEDDHFPIARIRSAIEAFDFME